MSGTDQTKYADLQTLVEQGRKLQSQAIFDAILWLIARLKTGSGRSGACPADDRKARTIENLESPLHVK